MPRGITFRNISDLVSRDTMNRKITDFLPRGNFCAEASIWKLRRKL